MAVDKKSQHVGNHGGAYTDMDGMRRQFTYIDHDVKTKIAAKVYSEEEKSETKRQLEAYREKIIQDILALSASMLPLSHNHTWGVFRDNDGQKFTWHETALRDPTIQLETLQAVRAFTQTASGIPH